MRVETFEAINLDEQGGAVINELVNEEAMALIESLGLTGQRKLLGEREVDGELTTTRNPYRRMTARELAVYGALMPNRTEIAEYEDGPIPLRALQVAAHAGQFFPVIQVWHPEPGRDDPILVGLDSKYSSDGFLLARWGEELLDFESLVVKARAIVETTVRARIAKAKVRLAMLEQTIDERINAFLATGKADSEHLSVEFTTRSLFD